MLQKSLARRYAPLAAVVVVQLLIIALAPSKAPDQVETFAGGEFEGTGGAADEFFGSGSGAGGGAGGSGSSTSVTAGGRGGGPAGSGGSAGGGGGGSGGGGGGSGGGGQSSRPPAPPGDTSHCVDGRQFDPAIDFHAPPCVPRFGGDNGGATYPGVTGDTIKIVLYYAKGNAAVDAILRAQDAFVEPEQHRAYNDAVEAFINSNYELYGREIEIITFEGNCEVIPPENDCLREEMRQIKADINPFWFVWNSSLSSQTYDELSRLGVMNSGGWHFRDSFAQDRRPFRWDVQMSGTEVVRHFAEYWCKQLAPFPVAHAGTGNPSQNFNGQDRVLGVISTNDPQNQEMVQVDLKEALASECGYAYSHEFFYAQDITTADQQRRAAVNAMREDPTSTSVLCLCDLVAPIFLYAEEQQQSYYPENLYSGFGFMDVDAVGQTYVGDLGCPLRGRPCNFEDAFGLSSISAQEPENADRGSRIWAAGGGEGNPPYAAVSSWWDYYNMVGSLIQSAGPILNPGTVEEGAFTRLGLRGGGDTGQILRGFEPGIYSWNRDMRVTYFSTETVSSFNNEPGSYVQIQGPRVRRGEYQSGALQLPPKPR